MSNSDNVNSAPTWHLKMVTFLVSGLLILSTTYEGCTVNMPVDMYLEFQNQSFHAHYGFYLDEKSSNALWAFTIASTGISSIIGALIIPWVSNRFGNRIAAFGFGGAVICIGSLLGALSKTSNSFELLIISLTLTYGFGWSFGYACGTAYLAECSPPHLRGIIGAYANFGINIGALLAAALGFDEALGSRDLWPWYLGIGAIPSAIALILCPFIWESPKRVYFWHNNRNETKKLLEKFYGKNYHRNIADPWSVVIKDFEEEREQAPKHLPLKELFTTYHLRQAVILITLTALFNNVCGPSITGNYSTSMYQTLGFSRLVSNVMTLAMSLPTPFINVAMGHLIERLGRRPIMIWGGVLTTATLLLYVLFSAILHYTHSIAVAYMAVFCILFNNWLASAPYSVTCFLYAEIVPQYALGMMTMYSVVMGNIFYIVVTQLFLPLQTVIDFYAILILAALPTAGTVVYFWRYQQETRSKSTNEIVRFWVKGECDSTESLQSRATKCTDVESDLKNF